MAWETEVCRVDGVDVWGAGMREQFFVGFGNEGNDRVWEAVGLGAAVKEGTACVY